jgi:ketosteroid isomerase-like protein
MDDDQVMKVLRSFGKAFNKGDVAAILECVTDDFEWRLAAGPDAPDGRIVSGKSAVRDALAERDEFTDGTKIDKRGVDIYQFRDGKIAVKDSYWKHIT